MAQADYAIANAAGAVVRGDINDNLEAIVTLNSGSGAPADTFPYMFWVDTTSAKIRQRNAANTAWIEIGDIDVAYWNLIQRLKESGGTVLSAGSIPDGYPVVRVGSNLIGQGVRRIRESGGVDLPMGTVADGQILSRVGNEIKGISDYLPDGYSNWGSYFPKIPLGDGSDGDVTITTDTTLAAGVGGIKVMQYNNLTINTGVYLQGNTTDKGLVILVKGTLTLNGQILMNERGGAGGAGVVGVNGGRGGSAGAFGAGGGGDGWGVKAGGGGGGGGVPGLDGSKGGNYLATDQWKLGGYSKGKGGDGIEGQVGGTGVNYVDNPKSPFPYEIARILFGAGGGSGGNGSAGGLSGAGGRGGGVVWIEAKNIVWGGSGLVSANGGAGSSGATAGRGGGGGGGGGAVQVVYKTKTGSSTLTANGGVGGAAGSGSDKAGGAGAAGITGEFQV